MRAARVSPPGSSAVRYQVEVLTEAGSWEPLCPCPAGHADVPDAWACVVRWLLALARRKDGG
jgi:hypothetical protein